MRDNEEKALFEKKVTQKFKDWYEGKYGKSLLNMYEKSINDAQKSINKEYDTYKYKVTKSVFLLSEMDLSINWGLRDRGQTPYEPLWFIMYVLLCCYVYNKYFTKDTFLMSLMGGDF
jgi:hypothetical protein